MNVMPLVSIVLTSYNHKEYLEAALDSIFSQSYENIEIIIIDDCSTDGSQTILENYKIKYPNILLRLLDSNTGSYVHSSNLGADLATGDFLNFAQCDDFADCNQIKKLVSKAILNPDAGVVYSRSHLINNKGYLISDDFQNREISFRKMCVKDSLIIGEKMFDFLSYSCVIPNLSSAIIRRDLFIKAGGLSSKYKVAADWALWMQLTFYTNFYYISESLNFFRQHPHTIRNTIKFEDQVIELFDIFYSYLTNNKLSAYKKIKLKIGSNVIWLSSIIASPIIFLNTFSSIYRKTLKFNKYNILFLFICMLKVFRESIYRTSFFKKLQKI